MCKFVLFWFANGFNNSPLGFSAMLLQLLLNMVGLPMQAIATHTAHSAAALSITKYLLLVSTILAYFCYGFFEKCDRHIWVPQAPALIFALIILGQMLYYRDFQY